MCGLCRPLCLFSEFYSLHFETPQLSHRESRVFMDPEEYAARPRAGTPWVFRRGWQGGLEEKVVAQNRVCKKLEVE